MSLDKPLAVCVWCNSNGKHWLKAQTSRDDAEETAGDVARQDSTVTDVIVIEHYGRDQEAHMIVTVIAGTIEAFRAALDENEAGWTLRTTAP